MKQLLVVAALIFLSASCKNKNAENTTHAAHEKDTAGVYYTCSMHPQVMESKPGNCPICGMKMIAVKKNTTQDANEVKLSAQQILLGNIQTDTIRSNAIGDELVLTATLNFDQSKTTSVSSRVMGRVEKLYFKNLGEFIRKGIPLYDLYSEELNSAEQEYLLALDRKQTFEKETTAIDYDQLLQSAKNKLLLWNLSESQIRKLVANKNASPTTTFYSTSSGYITELGIREGDYVAEGGTIVKLAGLSTLWVEAQVYTSQFSAIDRNGIAVVQLPEMQGREIKGKIEFVNPEINPDTRINLIRVSIPNTGNQLKPGMSAYVVLKSRQHQSLTLPIDAVLRDGKDATVWVKTGPQSFKIKMVTAGMESEDRIEIKSGLMEGDIVVIKGAYLLNSEYIFKQGANPMAGMKM